MRTEINVSCNDGTKYRVRYNDSDNLYVLESRNDLKPLKSYEGIKIKGKWIWIDSTSTYLYALNLMFEEIKNIDAITGA